VGAKGGVMASQSGTATITATDPKTGTTQSIDLTVN
jgi:hypothetical protein